MGQAAQETDAVSVPRPAVPANPQRTRWSGLWESLSPSVPLLPVLAVYALVTAVHPLGAGYGDEGAYLAYAKNLTHGFFTQGSDSVTAAYLWHPPLLPLLLVPMVALHLPLTVTRILVSPLLMFLALAVFHRMVRWRLSDRSALLATYALAAYLPFFPGLRAVFVEPVAALCFTLAVFFLLRAYYGGRRDHVWAGLAFGLVALSRAEYGYVLLAALLLSAGWLLLSRRSICARRSTVACVVGLLVCLPWLAYTYSVTGKPFYWGDSGGLSLYWMTAPGTVGDVFQPNQALAMPGLAAERPVFLEWGRLKPLKRDGYLTHVALQNIRHHPAHYLSNVVNNVDRLIFNSPYSFTNEKASSMLYAVPNALLLGALVLAALVAVRTRRRLGRGVLPVAVLLALGFLVHVPVMGEARFLAPLVPAAVWLLYEILAPIWPEVSAAPPAPGRDTTSTADAETVAAPEGARVLY
jgi:4-amino-4-deoxy-L-arabinose transferase-like glycosyltransferase